MSHCECNYVPDVLTLGDVGELAALVAPRRLCLVNGRQDRIFPSVGVGEPYTLLEQAYSLAGAPSATR